MFIEAGQIELIEGSEAEFCRFVSEYVEHVLAEVRLYPRLSPPRLIEVYGAWCNDMKHVENRERKLDDGLDHFKRCGHLAFWLRRFTPLIECVDTTQNTGDAPGYSRSEEERRFLDFLFAYGNEYLAFDIGYQFCKFYESNKTPANSRATDLFLSIDYIEMICHFMKYKTVSPHAMTMVYKSLFYNPT